MNKLFIALGIVAASVSPAGAQQQPLFNPQGGGINPNGAWGQPQQQYNPPVSRGPYGGREWSVPDNYGQSQQYNQQYDGGPIYRGPSPFSAPGACGFRCDND